MGNHWALRKPPQVLIEEIEGFLACYVMSTGQTHILDAFPAEIMRVLFSEPKSTAQIREHLAVQMDDAGDSWVAKVEEVLAELQTLRMVESRVL
jgi:PqqD family protein of HPr-rel-A system